MDVDAFRSKPTATPNGWQPTVNAAIRVGMHVDAIGTETAATSNGRQATIYAFAHMLNPDF
jgi:hypothetical protein